MNDEIVRLLRDTANNFAALADAFEQEHKNTNARMEYLEHAVCDTKDTLKCAAEMILRM